jgi:CheY-like chemotaxis protein
MKGYAITILLVEDDPAHAEIVRRNIENAQVANQLNWVEDGQAALDYLHRVGPYQDPKTSPMPGLILLDLCLPKVDGLEVLKIIKASPEMASIPVVVMTSSANESDLARAYALKVNSYVVKPLNLQKFTALLNTIGCFELEWNERPQTNSARSAEPQR